MTLTIGIPANTNIALGAKKEEMNTENCGCSVCTSLVWLHARLLAYSLS